MENKLILSLIILTFSTLVDLRTLNNVENKCPITKYNLLGSKYKHSKYNISVFINKNTDNEIQLRYYKVSNNTYIYYTKFSLNYDDIKFLNYLYIFETLSYIIKYKDNYQQINNSTTLNNILNTNIKYCIHDIEISNRVCLNGYNINNKVFKTFLQYYLTENNNKSLDGNLIDMFCSSRNNTFINIYNYLKNVNLKKKIVNVIIIDNQLVINIIRKGDKMYFIINRNQCVYQLSPDDNEFLKLSFYIYKHQIKHERENILCYFNYLLRSICYKYTKYYCSYDILNKYEYKYLKSFNYNVTNNNNLNNLLALLSNVNEFNINNLIHY